MDSWTLQVGYPIMTIERNYDTNSASITQKRYLSDRVRSRSETEYCWDVPLSFTDSEEKDFNKTYVSFLEKIQRVDLFSNSCNIFRLGNGSFVTMNLM